MDGKTWFDAIGLIASVASLVLAILAIWMSWAFYRASEAASKSSAESAKEISAAVARLEKLFDRMYSDTFSIMKDTVSDMRKHIWRAPTATAEQQEEIKERIAPELRAVFSGKEKPDPDQVAEKIGEALASVFGKAIKTSKIDERKLVDLVRTLRSPTLKRLADAMEMEEEDVAIPLFMLRQQGKVTWRGRENAISSETRIELGRKQARDEEDEPGDSDDDRNDHQEDDDAPDYKNPRGPRPR